MVRWQGTRRLYRARPEGLAERRAFVEDFWDQQARPPQDRGRGRGAEARAWRLTPQASSRGRSGSRARPETVSEFLTDPALLLRWKGTEAGLDPRPGGVTASSSPAQHRARRVRRGRAALPRRLSCGFEEPDETVPPGASTAEVTLTPDGNSTILRLVHRDLLEPSRSQHDKTRTKPSAGLEPATPSLP